MKAADPDLTWPIRIDHQDAVRLHALSRAGPTAGSSGRRECGTREDKSVDFKIKFGKVPLREWLPAGWDDHVAGAAAGDVHWSGKNPKIESSQMQGSLRVEGGRVRRLPFLEKLSSLTGKKEIEELELNECSAEVDWNNPKVEVKNIAVEDKGKFRIEGALSTVIIVRRRAPARRGPRISRMAAERGGGFSEREGGLSLDHGAFVGNIDKPERLSRA